jgi:transposase
MSPAFIKGVRENLPEAEVTFDRFHLMKTLNDAVDRVRRLEVKTDPNLKGLKFVFLKNSENLTSSDLDRLSKIRFADCGKKTLKAYQIKELFRELYTAGTDEVFEIGLKKWYYLATHSRIDAIKDAAKTIKRHWDGVMNWIKSKINNGILEGIASLLQAAKARARGYSSQKNFKIIAYLLTGKMDFSKINSAYLPT